MGACLKLPIYFMPEVYEMFVIFYLPAIKVLYFVFLLQCGFSFWLQ